MSSEVDLSLSHRTSRRTIVRTGAKLGYAAPLVAASMHVHAASAAPVSAPTTGRVVTCFCRGGSSTTRCASSCGPAIPESTCITACLNSGGMLFARCDSTGTCAL